MDLDDLPNEFDIVILGTGLTETIAAAAFSRIGLKVLHLDRNDYYGGSFANFNLQGIEDWKIKNEAAESQQTLEYEVTDELRQLVGDGKRIFSLPRESALAHEIKTCFHVRERTAEENAEAERLKSKMKSRGFFAHLEACDNDASTVGEVKQGSDENSQSILDDSAASSSNQNEQLELEQSDVENLPTGDGSVKQTDSMPVSDSNSIATQEVKEEELNSAGSEDKKEGEVEKSSENVEAEEAENKSVEWTVEGIKEDWRKYCFDLSPKVLYCSGDLVELLIQSDVARYCEFRTVSRVLTLLNDSLQQVPCSRADVFSSKIVSLIEKRLMMKFLQFAADFEKHPDEYQEFKDKPFVDFLKSKKLTSNVQHFVQHAIAMVSDVETTEQGLKSTQRFLRSLGRYGNTAFLFPLYGSGELPQAFSRLSAVFGGTYCLMMSASHIIADGENKCCAIITTQGKQISCKYVVAEASYLPSTFVQYPEQRRTSRAVFITDKSVHDCKDPELSMLNFVCSDRGDQPVLVMELPASACVCPKGLYVVHLIRESGCEGPEKDFEEVTERLFGDGSADEKPRILWSLYFSHNDLSQVSLTSESVGNVFVTSGGGDSTIDMERSVNEAKEIFLQVCPDEEFLPKPPNPEDIIYVDDAEKAVASGPGEFEATGQDGNGGKKEEEAKEGTDEKVLTGETAAASASH